MDDDDDDEREGYEPMDREGLEAVAASARDLARMVRAQYEGFGEVGFTEGEAMLLTMKWMEITLG
jgi:hypothetical protein